MKNGFKGLAGCPPASPLDVGWRRRGSRNCQRALGGMCCRPGCAPPPPRQSLDPSHIIEDGKTGVVTTAMALPLPTCWVCSLLVLRSAARPHLRAPVSAFGGARDPPLHHRCAPCASTRAGWISMSGCRSLAVDGGGQCPCAILAHNTIHNNQPH
jgi:hypothetical protein